MIGHSRLSAQITIYNFTATRSTMKTGTRRCGAHTLQVCLYEVFFPLGKYFFLVANIFMQYFLQTQRALLLQRVRVQSGRGLVEVKVRKHRKIEDMQPENDGAKVLDRGLVLEAAGRQEDVGPGAGVQLPTLRGGRRGARPGVRQHPAKLEIPAIKNAYILYIDDCMYYIVLCSYC